MPHFHLRFNAPNSHPYDTDTVRWQLLGDVVLPFVEQNLPSRFWFSRYHGGGVPSQIFLRYESDKMAKNLPTLDPEEHHEFDIIEDLSGPRFLGDNEQNRDRNIRGNLLFDFLHTASRLTLAQLSHLDNAGYWQIEKNSDHVNNHFGSSLESMHHLFCNLSSVPTAVVLVPSHENTPAHQTRLISPFYAKMKGLYSDDLSVARIYY